MTQPFRMLHVGRTADVATSPHRMRAFQAMGFAVTPLDLSTYVETGGRLAVHLRLKFGIGPGIGPLNRRFAELAAQTRPDLIWVDKGLYLWPSSVRAAREASGAAVIHFHPDDPFTNPLGRRVFLKALPEYDVHVVPRDVNIDEYRRAGAKAVVRYHWAFDPAIHRPLPATPQVREALGGPVGFIGDWEEQREQAIRHLAEAGLPVRVWGPRWHYKSRWHNSHLRIEDRPLMGEDYPQALCAFDINLGFLRKLNRDLSTTRSVEIPACGAFLLGERTGEHLAMFQEGKEAEFFDSPAELLEKTRYYLAHPDQRQAIARQGRQRCLSSGYDHVARQTAVLKQIEKILSRPLLPP